jgi:uncharacterized protein
LITKRDIRSVNAYIGTYFSEHFVTTLAIISDIHGCLPALDSCLDLLVPRAPDYYLLVGDVLNHGPRNPVPSGYNPPLVAERLNQLKTQIIAVRGNCDSEVDQMLLDFPCLSPYNYLLLGQGRCCMTHGHLFSLQQLALRPGDVLLSGHTHVAGFTEPSPGILAMNPGSIAMPREGYSASFGVYQGGVFSIYGLDGSLLVDHSLPGY